MEVTVKCAKSDCMYNIGYECTTNIEIDGHCKCLLYHYSED